jgi:SAM-dependent methyltransferase
MRAYWDAAARENAAWYVDTSLSFKRPDMEKFLETGRVIVSDALDDPPVRPAGTGTAIEIGCGLGRVCRALAERFDHVIGVDISAEMLAKAREVVDDPKIRFVHGDGLTLSGIDGASADLVLTFTVFQHIPSHPVIEGYVREAGRVLRPGGVFVFQWNNEPGARWWALRRGVLSTLQRTGVWKEQRKRNDAAFLGSKVPMATIRSWADAAGLDIAGTRNEGSLYAWAWAVKR